MNRMCLERTCSTVMSISLMVNGRCRPCYLRRERIRRVNRPAVDRIYNTFAWQRLRAVVLAEEHRCAWCGAVGVKLTAGHVIPMRRRPDLALERSNVHASCRSCQNRAQNRSAVR